MIILTKENILSYIKEHVPSLQLKEPVKVSMIGEGDLGEDVEGDGYCNYVFRVSDADGHYMDMTSDFPRIRQIPLGEDGKPLYNHHNFWHY